MRGTTRFAAVALGVILAGGSLGSAPVGAAATPEQEAYVKNCRGLLPTLPVGTTEGTEGDDVMVGTNHDDVIYGNGGNDLICGRDGNDTIYGGAGEDQLFGNDGRDSLYGGPGRDTLAGMPGCDRLDGGNGNDLLKPGPGGPTYGGSPDCLGTVDGGAGSDHVLVGACSVNHYLGGPGIDLLDFHPNMGHLTIDLSAGLYTGDIGCGDFSASAVEFERARGTWGSDTLIGTEGPNRLAGMHGGDIIWGRGGDDFLNGGPDLAGDPADTLYGEAGFDTCANGEVVNGCEA
jgi:Ca2+-binding RTX toxin-like protein